MAKKITGFVAEFPHGMMDKKLKELNLKIPESWVAEKHNFKVTADMGRELELAFWDWEEDKQIGTETFVVDYDDVICWA